MDSYIDNFAASVRRILDRSTREPNDFISLSISGEQLRRACEVGDASREARETLAEYDSVLRAYRTPSIDELGTEVSRAVSDLESYAASKPSLRDASVGKDVLLHLDETLSVVAAGVRAGSYEANAANALATGLVDRVGKLASKCNELAQFAEDRQILFGEDPLLSDLYQWWEPLAELAPSRLALQTTVVAEARRERLIDAAVTKFGATRSQPLLARITDALVAMLGRPIAATRPGMQISYSGETRLPDDQDELFAVADFSVFRAGGSLVFKVTTPHTLEVISITFGVQTLPVERLDTSCSRVSLPDRDGKLRAVVRIDGDELELPEFLFRIEK